MSFPEVKDRHLNKGWVKDLVRIEQSKDHPMWTENNFLSEWEVPNSFIFGLLLDLNPAEAEGGKNLVGFSVWRKVLDEAHILSFAIEARYRGVGLGKVLVAEVCSEMLRGGVRWAHLECRESNTVAQSLYRSMCFMQVGVRPYFYHDTNEGALLYTKDLFASSDGNYRQ